MTKDEALKKAFKQAFQLGQDYLYQADHEYVSQNKKSDVTRAKFEQLMEDAIKEALAQPEQEPVAWMNDMGTHIDLNVSNRGTPLYTTLPQRTWVGLTDDELSEVYNQADWDTVNGWEYERAIEAKLRSKND